ncbi:MAG: DUF4260 domain-containing protein [Gemmatimonadaceae bacterium]|nr:DUF4260 domain-containing protein [Chitinophagaceae bacterium]
MKSIIKLEELAMTIAGIYLLTQHSLGLSIWIWIPLFLAPDISMLGYLVNTKVGAFTYNVFHHKGIAIAVAAAGYFFHSEILLTTGLLLFSHSSFDRIMGYGLKYSTGFKDTHLGRLPEGGKGSREKA